VRKIKRTEQTSLLCPLGFGSIDGINTFKLLPLDETEKPSIKVLPCVFCKRVLICSVIRTHRAKSKLFFESDTRDHYRLYYR
jgi:hypothetical protein